MGIDRFEAGIIFDGKNPVIGFVKEDDGDIVSYKQHLESHAYDEAKERELFELERFKTVPAYRKENGEYKDFMDEEQWFGWKSCAKSRARSAE